MKKRLFGIMLAIFMVVTLIPAMAMTVSAADGDACVSTTDCTGTYANGICSICDGYQPAVLNGDGVYEIGNAGQLLWFAKRVNTNAADLVVDTAVKLDAKLTADIDMTGLSWIPIGQCALNDESIASSNGFGGTFDGCGHSVSGIDCTVTKTGDSSVLDTPTAGFFGNIYGATIRNLIVEGSFSAVYDGTSNNPSARAGGIVAEAGGSSEKTNLIENCGFRGSVSVKGNSTALAGGMAGYFRYGTMKNCWSAATIESTGASFQYCGGFVGNTNGTYENCYYDSTLCTLKAQYGGDLSGVTGKASSDFAEGAVCEMFGDHSLDENCVCKICGKEQHSSVNGFCTVCDGYEPAILVSAENHESLGLTADFIGYYAIDNAGKLYWFADKVDNEHDTYGSVNVVLTDNITVNAGTVTAGTVTAESTGMQAWTPIGDWDHQYGGTFDGN